MKSYLAIYCIYSTCGRQGSKRYAAWKKRERGTCTCLGKWIRTARALMSFRVPHLVSHRVFVLVYAAFPITPHICSYFGRYLVISNYKPPPSARLLPKSCKLIFSTLKILIALLSLIMNALNMYISSKSKYEYE